MPSGTDATCGLADQVMLQRLGEAIVVLNAATGQYYELNETGADMLELWLQSEGEMGPVVAALTRRYEAPEAQLRADLTALLEELRAAGIINPQQ